MASADELWKGVEFKFDNARFHRERMGRLLGPPENTSYNVALQSSGAIIDTGWRRSFYAHFDAFLSATRSVAEVINCCFGHDKHPKLKNWFIGQSPDEQKRRKMFSQCFKKVISGLGDMLSAQRDILANIDKAMPA